MVIVKAPGRIATDVATVKVALASGPIEVEERFIEMFGSGGETFAPKITVSEKLPIDRTPNMKLADSPCEIICELGLAERVKSLASTFTATVKVAVFTSCPARPVTVIVYVAAEAVAAAFTVKSEFEPGGVITDESIADRSGLEGEIDVSRLTASEKLPMPLTFISKLADSPVLIALELSEIDIEKSLVSTFTINICVRAI